MLSQAFSKTNQTISILSARNVTSPLSSLLAWKNIPKTDFSSIQNTLVLSSDAASHNEKKEEIQKRSYRNKQHESDRLNDSRNAVSRPVLDKFFFLVRTFQDKVKKRNKKKGNSSYNPGKHRL